MPASDDILFGKIAVQKGFVSQEQIDECVNSREGVEKPVPLGKLLVDKGYLTLDQLQEVLEAQKAGLESEHSVVKAKKKDSLFGRLAVREGFITEDELNDCIRIQASLESAGHDKRLGEVMVENEFLTPHQVQEILYLQRKRILECSKCETFFNIAGYTPGTRFKCSRCGTTLSVPSRADEIRADETMYAKHGEFPLPPPMGGTKPAETVIIPPASRPAVGGPPPVPATGATPRPGAVPRPTPVPGVAKSATPLAAKPSPSPVPGKVPPVASVPAKTPPPAPGKMPTPTPGKVPTPVPTASPQPVGIKVKCPICDKVMEVAPALEHKRVKCEKCVTTFTAERVR